MKISRQTVRRPLFINRSLRKIVSVYILKREAPTKAFIAKYCMLPKAMLYFSIVILVYKYYIDKFLQVYFSGITFANLITELPGGVFYRKFTKLYSFTASNHLGKLHVHLLVLVFILPILFFGAIIKNYY